MRITPLSTILAAAFLTTGVLATSTAALADPPWARGGHGYRHGGPPPWAPAHGWRRKHERFGYGYDRPYRAMRHREYRYGGYRY